jgi:hypothetical protein
MMHIASQTQSTPQAERTVGEQVPWKHQIQTGITQRETAPDPRKQGLKRRAENEIVKCVPGQETRHDVKKRRIEHGQPDRLHSSSFPLLLLILFVKRKRLCGRCT